MIEVDDKRHFAIVEPGVAYFDLYRHIQDRGLKVWIDCPDPGWGSSDGQRAGPRRRLHIRRLPRSLPLALRARGRPAERRHRADRHGRAAGRQDAGPSTATASVRRWTVSLRRAISASSPRWGSICCRRRRRTRPASSPCRGARDIVPLIDLVNELEHAGLDRHAGILQPAWRLRPSASGTRRAAEAAWRRRRTRTSIATRSSGTAARGAAGCSSTARQR